MLYNVKAGIIGLNSVGKSFTYLLKDHIKHLKLMAAYGKTQGEQLFAKNELSLQYVYSDPDQLISNHDVDTVFIFADPDQRASLAGRAIEAGKHVFIGMPMTTNVEDAEMLVKIAEGHPSQKVMAGFPWRLEKRMKILRQYIASGKIGKINSFRIDSNVTQNLSSRYIISSGSPFIDHAINEIDLCLWMLDSQPKSVRSYEKGDELHSVCIMENDVVFNLIVYRDVRRRKGAIEITGSEGVLSFDTYYSQVIRHYSYDKESEKIIHIDEDLPFNSDYLHVRDFIDSIMGKSKSELHLRSNVEALKAAIAMEKSKVLQKEISLQES